MKLNPTHLSLEKSTSSGSPLFTYERRQKIAQILSEQQRVTVPELSRLFSISEVTIRKDLAWLEAHALAVRTHGGAMQMPAQAAEIGFDVRERLQESEKERIGASAATFVQDGETIALDASTTALAMTSFLRERRELTVVTNGLRASMDLVSVPGISVLIPGGMLRKESFSLVGSWGAAVLQHIHISKAFVGARGLGVDEGLTDVNSEEVELKRVLVQSAKEVIAVLDSSKWGQVALATFCPLERLTRIITNAKAPEQMVEQIRSRGIDVLLV